MARWMLICALATGCASAEDDVPGLDGLWITRNGPCLVEMDFADGVYSTHLACELESGTTGVYFEAGDYVVTSDVISFTRLKTSCPTMGSNDPLTFTLRGNTLETMDDQNTLIFERIDASERGTGRLGCFHGDGTFTEHEAVDL